MSNARRLIAVALVCTLLGQSCGVAVGAAVAVSDPEPSRAVSATGSTSAAGTTAESGSNAASPQILAIYPNPLTAGDTGEFVVVRVDGVSNLTLSDGEQSFSIPPRSGVVVLSSDPNTTRSLTPVPVVSAALSLSNAGERLVLRRNGTTVHEIRYEDAPAGERWNASTGRWTPLGLDLREPVATGPADATAFVLPDASTIAVETLRSADERLFLAGYTLSSARVADALVAAHHRGVRVRVLVEGGPVGGVSRRQAETLDRLVRAGVPVAVVAGPGAKFSFHHAKYAVVDDRALVLTENWKPAGTGGRDSRGWGVRVESMRAAEELATVFERDSTGRGIVSWKSYRRGRAFVTDPPPNATYPTTIPPESVHATDVRVLTTPGNAGKAVIRRLDEADTQIAVVNPRLDPDGRFFAALVRAARRGVTVRILLSNAWYDADENERVVTRTQALRDSGVPIEARIAEPRGRFGKVHAKGAVVDGESVLVGSLNWNDHAATENREVVLELDGPEPASYYQRAFDSDWQSAGGGDDSETMWVLVAGALASASLAGLILKKAVRFER
ncbi:phosphatidylserine synthase [Halogeometricum borinquense]|uniref:Phosphatidylserine synthase n=1 Tax=Halogeometricum borinquense TaxID=60847 RepID=A0A6C0UL00_9EURY|nr:phospholipase D-like domain-containing protein [Halogeometricum borinquense]QIB73658.1 phosphatidylserine synthase [Halogeometricum borinquense]QIQ76986.1 phosphatidylserine synthase [Halogeometricum borinquense]